MIEAERLRLNREYFERGCLCLIDGRMKRRNLNEPDKAAVAFYEKNCTCSRNYIKACSKQAELN